MDAPTTAEVAGEVLAPPVGTLDFQHETELPYANKAKKRVPDWERIRSFVVRNFLVLGFAVALTVALSWPAAGSWFAQWQAGSFKLVQTINVIIIFIISGATLKTSDVRVAVSKEGRKGFAFGCVSILLLTSLAGFVMVKIPFALPEFSYGLAVFCAVPTTLSSGVTLVALAGGNDALALLLVVTTNMLGVVTTPFLLKAILSGASVSIDAAELLVKLVVTVLAPIVLGKVLRDTVPGLASFTRRHKTALSLTSSVMLIMVMWQNLSTARDDIVKVAFASILAVIAAGVILHGLFLAFNYPIVQYILRLPPREMKAVVIISSEKTLPIALTVLGYLTDLGNAGLMAVPCIIAQVSQLFMDSYVVSRWAARAAAEKKAAALEAAASESTNTPTAAAATAAAAAGEGPKRTTLDGFESSSYGSVVVQQPQTTRSASGGNDSEVLQVGSSAYSKSLR